MTEQVKLLDLRFMEAMIFALIVALPTLSPEMAVTRWLGNPYMVWIGKRSYSIYIWQQLLFYPLGFSLLMNVVTLPVRIALVFTTAAISYRFIEQPMIQKGRVLERRVESRTAEQVRVSVASAD
jgi:peptidoglycan/LPS O-acetylase OafA/YrhL